jgi:predicted signal transduction protein with EAL and GGDEF domain
MRKEEKKKNNLMMMMIMKMMMKKKRVMKMSSKKEDEVANTKTLLTLPNIRYLVEGLDALLYTNLDGDKRAKVIQLRDELISYINSIFTDYS